MAACRKIVGKMYIQILREESENNFLSVHYDIISFFVFYIFLILFIPFFIGKLPFRSHDYRMLMLCSFLDPRKESNDGVVECSSSGVTYGSTIEEHEKPTERSSAFFLDRYLLCALSSYSCMLGSPDIDLLRVVDNAAHYHARQWLMQYFPNSSWRKSGILNKLLVTY